MISSFCLLRRAASAKLFAGSTSLSVAGVLVTSAFHVPRAQGCFRAAEVEADFLPVDYRMRDPARNPHWLPRASVLADTAAVVRERFGFLVYRVMGYAR